jgi:tetratricopeptide (TPR) repeat protein
LANRPSDAFNALNRAIAIKPRADAYAVRSTLRPIEDRAGRKADIDAALKLDPKSALALAQQARLQRELDGGKAVIATLSQTVADKPDSPLALYQRAMAHQVQGNQKRALADAAAAIKVDPSFSPAYLLRADVFIDQRKVAAAIREAEAGIAASPGNVAVYIRLASIYRSAGRVAEAMRAYDRALVVKPDALVYLDRAEWRPKSDAAGREADIDAALKLRPGYGPALLAKAGLQSEHGDNAGAVATLSEAIAKPGAEPDSMSGLLGARGIAYARSGDMALAERDFLVARGQARTARALNDLCWEKAIAGVALESALADCDAAVFRARGNAAILDSRGFVLLRLGRFDDAIADYGRALAIAPGQASSLFGRAVARARTGDKTQSAADADAALKADANVKAEFEGYGIKL